MKEKNKRKRENLYKKLDILLKFVPPNQLKKSLYEVYALFLQNIDTTLLRKDFKGITMDLYFLHHFLEKAEEYEKE